MRTVIALVTSLAGAPANADVAGTVTDSSARTYIRPEIFLTNLFNAQYLLTGAFFSGGAFGRPFQAQFRLRVGM